MSKISPAAWELFLALFSTAGAKAESDFERLKKDLEKYIFLLLEANKHTNLTSITDFEEAVWKHLYDSLILVLAEPEGRVLDWGTGGGTPGIPLALYRRALLPENTSAVDFLDSIRKKILLVDGFLTALELSSSRVFVERGEILVARESYDSVVMRAVAPPERVFTWLSKKVKNYYFMTGPKQLEEWKLWTPKFEKKKFFLRETHQHLIPGGRGERFVLHFQQK